MRGIREAHQPLEIRDDTVALCHCLTQHSVAEGHELHQHVQLSGKYSLFVGFIGLGKERAEIPFEICPAGDRSELSDRSDGTVAWRPTLEVKGRSASPLEHQL